MTTKQKIKNILIIFIFMLFLTITCVFHAQIQPKMINFLADKFNIVSTKSNLLVHFIDVNQADAAAINLPDGKILLIDTGSKEINTTYINYIKENVLNTKRKDYIDYLVLSHADMDHVGGTMKLLKNFNIGRVFLPKIESETKGYTELLNYVVKNCKYEILGDEFVIEDKGYKITFFEILVETSTNSSSQVVKLECFNNSFLFLGDLSASNEKVYVEKYGNELDCDVLKIAHHGSKTSTSQEMIDATTPKHAVISVGENNDYGHPNFEVLNLLKENNVNVIRTDNMHDIMFICGKYYDCYNLNGKFYTTRLSLNYVGLVMVVDGLMILLSVVIVLKKEKNKHITI